MTPTSTNLTCNFSWLFSWKWFSPHYWHSEQSWIYLGRKFRYFGSVDLTSMWITGLHSWLSRSLKQGPRGCLMNTVMEIGTEQDLRDHLTQPFQAGADIPEPKGVKWLTQGLRMSRWQKPGQNPVLSSKGHPLPMDPYKAVTFGGPCS